jgi:4-hydroxybenzoate polyprenyltransferase
VITALAYLAITLTYSFFIKRKAIIDIVTLALLFTLRIVAGIGTAQSEMSPWLLAFSMFFFLSLAGMKRYTECHALIRQGASIAKGRGYRADDAPWLMSMGAASGFCSMLVFFIFLTDANSPIHNYPNPTWLWSICGVLGYWLSRTWLLTGRGEMNDDPVLFAVKDRLSLWLAAACVLVILLAKYT